MVRKIMGTIFCLLKLAKTILSVMLGAGIGNEKITINCDDFRSISYKL